MKFVLIIIYALTYRGAEIRSEVVEFDSIQTCETAKLDIEKQFKRNNSRGQNGKLFGPGDIMSIGCYPTRNRGV